MNLHQTYRVSAFRANSTVSAIVFFKIDRRTRCAQISANRMAQQDSRTGRQTDKGTDGESESKSASCRMCVWHGEVFVECVFRVQSAQQQQQMGKIQPQQQQQQQGNAKRIEVPGSISVLMAVEQYFSCKHTATKPTTATTMAQQHKQPTNRQSNSVRFM